MNKIKLKFNEKDMFVKYYSSYEYIEKPKIDYDNNKVIILEEKHKRRTRDYLEYLDYIKIFGDEIISDLKPNHNDNLDKFVSYTRK